MVSRKEARDQESTDEKRKKWRQRKGGLQSVGTGVS